MEYYVQEALCRIGEYKLVEKRMCERYSEMIAEDYSTLWENWVRGDGTANHAWSGGSLVIMSKYIAGIRPVVAGYEKVEISPKYDLHDTISCTVPTIKGEIILNVATEAGRKVINLEYPENMQVVLHKPENAVVTMNGKTIENDKSIITA